ncbi:leucine-rich repeat protein [uncultured Oscillibacter sp.]|uniref:leucine-rich repeat protein n=2 Tax=uncultured Oscillibacter sp. TaxID=876091 RepID=UPI0026225A56|nr:leucine-rich repeat protein [uncultured Oscillibacter sp.]
MMRRTVRLLSFLMALALVTGLAAPALAAETAAVIRLTKTTGTVEISKSSGKSVSLLKNMRLYNGYHVETDEESYAWINLDDSKLLKEDAASEVEVRKDGKKLEVLLCSGNIFFDVAEPLEDDESMNIHTSTTVVGIRGTSGWIRVVDRWTTEISVLEGTVECSVTDPVTNQVKAEPIKGGERVTCVVYPREQDGDKCDILREKFTVEDIPGFALTDLTRDIPLCDKIEQKTGLDIPRDLAAVAGGDPSGRTPDRESATKEVLDESDRREDEDEEDLHDRIEEVEKELEKQPDNISPSKPIEKPVTPAPETPDRDDSSDSGGSGTTTPTPTPPDPTPPEPTPDPDPDPGPEPGPDPDPDPTPPEPATYTIAFDANGGKWGTGTVQTPVQTNPDGTAAWPEEPVRAGYYLDGWYDAPEGGNQITADHVFTADGTIYAQWLSTAFAWKWDEATKTLTFSGQAPMPNYGPYSFSDREWKDYVGEVENVVIKNGLTNIGGYAFAYCSKLTSVTIPDSVTSIGQRAFSDCASLTDVTIPEGVTRIEDYAFYGCSVLSGTLTIPKGVTQIEECTFYGCSALSGTLTIPEGVTSIGEFAFKNCSGLTGTLTIPDKVASIGSNAFSGCSSLTGTLTIPDSVTSIDEWAFSNCSGLESVKIPGTVAQISRYAFRYCGGLTSVYISDGVSSIGERAFERCVKLTTVRMPKSVASVDNAAFSETNVATVNFGGSSGEWSAGRFYDTGLLLKNPTINFDQP